MKRERTLKRSVEMAREQLHIVRERAEVRPPARDHGKEYNNEVQPAADCLEQHDYQLHRLHNDEYPGGRREESARDPG